MRFRDYSTSTARDWRQARGSYLQIFPRDLAKEVGSEIAEHQHHRELSIRLPGPTRGATKVEHGSEVPNDQKRVIMLCSLCQGICLAELAAFETRDDDEIEKCELINTEKAYRHHSCFEDLWTTGQNGCELCLLISQVLEEEQSWNNDDKIYGSMEGDSEKELVLKLQTASSTQIYMYSVQGSERQEDAGIFEVAVVPTFSYQLPASSLPRTGPHAFYWRGLEVWAKTGKSCQAVALEKLKDSCYR